MTMQNRKTRHLTLEQVKKLCEVAESPLNTCLPIFLFDTGARIHEIARVRLEDISNQGDYYHVEIHDGRNENRELPLILCKPQLQDWLEAHPHRDKPEASLWVTGYGKTMSHHHMINILRELGQKAQQEYPECFESMDLSSLVGHDLRISSALFRSQKLSVKQIQQWYGWETDTRVKHIIGEAK